MKPGQTVLACGCPMPRQYCEACGRCVACCGCKRKKPVSSGHLALRFYKHAGWTREILEPYLTAGKLLDTEESHGDKPEYAYFILAVGSRFDMERLYTEQVSTVQRWYDGPPRESDLEYLSRLNW